MDAIEKRARELLARMEKAKRNERGHWCDARAAVDSACDLLPAIIAALTPPDGYVPERSVLVAATRLRKLASAATPMARSAYVKAAELIELAVSAARPEVP